MTCLNFIKYIMLLLMAKQMQHQRMFVFVSIEQLRVFV